MSKYTGIKCLEYKISCKELLLLDYFILLQYYYIHNNYKEESIYITKQDNNLSSLSYTYNTKWIKIKFYISI